MGVRPNPEPNRGVRHRRTKPGPQRVGRVKTRAAKAGCTDLEWEAIGHYFASDVNWNRTEACRRAGYKHPDKQGSRIFQRPAVVAEVERRRALLAEDVKVGPAEIINELKKIAFFNMLDYGSVDKDGPFTIDLSMVTREQMAAIGQFEIETTTVGKDDEAHEIKKLKFKPMDKMAALDKLARHLGLFDDKLSLSVKGDLGEQIMLARKRIRSGE